MGFKSYIKKILCYPFKLKYLNQKVFFYHTLKKHNFFPGNIEYIYIGFQILYLKKKTPSLALVKD